MGGPSLAERPRGAVERLGQDAELAGPAVDPLLLRLVRRPRALRRLLKRIQTLMANIDTNQIFTLIQLMKSYLGHADAALGVLLLGVVKLDQAGEPSGAHA